MLEDIDAGGFYILNDRMEPEAVSMMEHIEWMRTYNSVIMQDVVGNATVSTAFTGMSAFQVPHLFETMVFGGPYDGWRWNHKTLHDARKQHLHIVQQLECRQKFIGWLILLSVISAIIVIILILRGIYS